MNRLVKTGGAMTLLVLAGLPGTWTEVRAQKHDGDGQAVASPGLVLSLTTVLSACEAEQPSSGATCEAMILGLYSGFLAGRTEGDETALCLPDGLSAIAFVEGFLDYARPIAGYGIDDVAAASLIDDLLAPPGRMPGLICPDEGVAATAVLPGPGEVPVLTEATFSDTVRDDLAGLVSGADAAAGMALTERNCLVCHSSEQGEVHRVGPNLFGVVGSPAGSAEGFSYTDAIMAFADSGGVWHLAELAVYLRSPRDALPGTSMAHLGMREDAELLDMLAYLETLGPN